MFMIIHALLGVLIALNIHSTIGILLLGIVSHFLLDMVPHWDGGFDREYFNITGHAKIDKLNIGIHVIDIILIIILVVILEDVHIKGLIFGAFAALIPDLLKIGYATKLKDNKKYMSQLKFHARIQRDAGWLAGLIIQAIFLTALIMLIL